MLSFIFAFFFLPFPMVFKGLAMAREPQGSRQIEIEGLLLAILLLNEFGEPQPANISVILSLSPSFKIVRHASLQSSFRCRTRADEKGDSMKGRTHQPSLALGQWTPHFSGVELRCSCNEAGRYGSA